MINIALMAPLWSPKGNAVVSEWWGDDLLQVDAYDMAFGSFPDMPNPRYVYRRLVLRTPTNAGTVQTSVVDTSPTAPSVTWIPADGSPPATLTLDNAGLGRWILGVGAVTGNGGILEVPGAGTQLLSLAISFDTNPSSPFRATWIQSGSR